MKLWSRITALSVICVCWMACTKEEISSLDKTGLLAGTWKWEKTTVGNSPQPVNSGQTAAYYLHFSKEGNFSFLRDSIVLRAGNYTITEDPGTINSRAERLVLKLSDDPGQYTIHLGGDQLILEQVSRDGVASQAYYQRQ